MIRLLGLFILFSAQVQASAYFSDQLWPKRSIQVCWATRRDFRAMLPSLSSYVLSNYVFIEQSEIFQKAVRSIIEEQFTSERTGITFEGWETCGLIPADAMIVFAGNKTPQDEAVTIPRPEAFPAIILPGQGNLSGPSRTQLQAVALHEFGHLAGLAHEHAAYFEEASLDPNCQSIKALLKQETGAQKVGGYDAESIMNYCRLEKLRSDTKIRPTLSAGDTQVLYSIYN